VTPREANLLTIVGLAGLLAGVTFTAPRWARVFREPIPVASDETAHAGNGDAPASPAPSPSGEARRTISVKLFFNSKEEPGLVMEDRELAFSADLSIQLRSVVEELVKGPQEAELVPTLAPDTKVLDVFVTARGVAYVDLSKEASLGLPGGSSDELRTVYSVVNSITTNFPAIRRVQILVDDHPAVTLAGHVDLSRPLSPDMTLLAASTLTPLAPPAAESAPAPPPAPSPAS
jgi:hypothetical protein